MKFITRYACPGCDREYTIDEFEHYDYFICEFCDKEFIDIDDCVEHERQHMLKV
jgi:hypothetical protein